jgi:hypothetical protein
MPFSVSLGTRLLGKKRGSTIADSPSLWEFSYKHTYGVYFGNQQKTSFTPLGYFIKSKEEEYGHCV